MEMELFAPGPDLQKPRTAVLGLIADLISYHLYWVKIEIICF
jgi:hypothetical protein